MSHIENIYAQDIKAGDIIILDNQLTFVDGAYDDPETDVRLLVRYQKDTGLKCLVNLYPLKSIEKLVIA